MSLLDQLKQYLPVSSRSAHAMHHEIGEVHSELRELRELVDELHYKQDCFDTRVITLVWEALRREGEDELAARKRVFREMSPATGWSRLYQRGCTKLLAEFDKFCATNKLTYWLAQGSLLGAVRHGGFIPWDDDLDVGMMRQELSRAIEAVKTDSRYRITVLYDYCVSCRQVRFRYADEAIPCFIDIFVFDPVSSCDADTLAKRENARARLVSDLCGNQGLEYWNKDNQFVAAASEEAAPIANIFDFAVNALYTNGTYTESLKGAQGLIWAIDNVDSGVLNHEWYLVPKDVLFPLTKLDFEDLQVFAPAQPEAYLETYLGNIYELPQAMRPYYNHMAGDSTMQKETRRVLLELLGDSAE